MIDDLEDDQPVLDQLHWWVCVDPQRDYDYGDEVLALAVAARAVFSPWGEREWRKAVEERQREDDVERVVREHLQPEG